MKKQQETFTINSTFDLQSLESSDIIASGDSVSNSSVNEHHADILNNINRAIKKTFQNIQNKADEDYEIFKSYINAAKYDEALDFLKSNAWQFFGNEDFFETLEKIDLDVASDKNKVGILMLIKCKIKEDKNDFTFASKKLPAFLEKYADSINDSGLLNELKYCLAYSNVNRDNTELALVQLNELLKIEDVDKSIKRRIYGLKADLEQNLKYLEIAGDIALEDNELTQAIALKMMLVDKLLNIDTDKAINIIEFVEELCDINKIDKKLMRAKILFNKANYFFIIGDFENALIEIEKTIMHIDNMTGTDIIDKRYSYCAFALQIAKNLKDEGRMQKYENEIRTLKSKITNNQFLDQLKIMELIDAKEYSELDVLKQKCIENNDCYIVFIMNIAIVIYRPELSFEKKLALLEEANKYIDINELRNADKANLYNVYANLFGQEKNTTKFIEYANKSLDLNIYQYELRDNYINMLIKENKWNEVEVFCDKCINLFGELPNFMFLYAKSLCMQDSTKEKKGKAYSILAKILPSLQDELKEEANQLIIKQAAEGIEPNNSYFEKTKQNSAILTLSDFETALDEFKSHVELNVRMQFWKSDKNAQDKHVYVNSPENIAKILFISFFNGKFGDNIKIVEEYSAGAGYVDIYLMFSSFKILIELKMCGHGYTSTYALEGKEQLKHYHKNSDSSLGYLLVFDSRIRDIGKFLNESIKDKTYTIISKAIDIRPIVK